MAPVATVVAIAATAVTAAFLQTRVHTDRIVTPSGVALGGVGTSDRIVLTGFALSLMLHAAVSYLLLKAEVLRAVEAQTWLAGSTGFVRIDGVIALSVGVLPFVALGLWCGRDLPLLAHDDTSATALGVNLKARRAALLVAATGISAKLAPGTALRFDSSAAGSSVVRVCAAWFPVKPDP